MNEELLEVMLYKTHLHWHKTRNWTWTGSDICRLQATEIKFLRTIKNCKSMCESETRILGKI